MNHLRKGRCPKMNRKQFVLTLLVAVISGFLGGALSVWFLMPQSVLAQDEPQKVIEAEEFRLVDSGGTTRATLGLGRFLRDSVGLYLFNEDGKVRVELEHSVPEPLFQTGVVNPEAGGSMWDLSPDGQEFFVTVPVPGSERRIRVVLNWADELQRLVPTN